MKPGPGDKLEEYSIDEVIVRSVISVIPISVCVQPVTVVTWLVVIY